MASGMLVIFNYEKGLRVIILDVELSGVYFRCKRIKYKLSRVTF